VLGGEGRRKRRPLRCCRKVGWGCRECIYAFRERNGIIRPLRGRFGGWCGGALRPPHPSFAPQMPPSPRGEGCLVGTRGGGKFSLLPKCFNAKLSIMPNYKVVIFLDFFNVFFYNKRDSRSMFSRALHPRVGEIVVISALRFAAAMMRERSHRNGRLYGSRPDLHY